MSSAFFETKDLTLAYNRARKREGFLGFFRKPAPEHIYPVNNVSLAIPRPGMALAIIGESGCGKSSFWKAVGGRVALPKNVGEYSGEIWLEGENLMEMSESELHKRIRWKKIAIVPQDPTGFFNDKLKIGTHLVETLKTHGALHAVERARKLLDDVDLPSDSFDRYSHQLSGGQLQRAVVAMALTMEASLIILDEPTSALDVSVRGELLNLLLRLKRERNISYIFITHEIGTARKFADLFAVFYGGRLVEFGSTELLWDASAHPTLHRYTQKLLLCAEQPREGEFVSIPGEPPDLASTVHGCPFAEREAVRCAACRADVMPPLRDVGGGHLIACHGV